MNCAKRFLRVIGLVDITMVDIVVFSQQY